MDQDMGRGLIDKYTITWSPKLGQGSFGSVYIGQDSTTGEIVAAKQIHIYSDDMFKSATTEMRIMQALQEHKNILKLYGDTHVNGEYWLFLEYGDLGNLKQYLKRNTLGLTKAEKVKVMHQSSSAISFMHGHKPPIIHRDINLENILMKRESGQDIVKLADFGASRMYDEIGQMSTICGARYYMAPELSVENLVKYDSSVDIFALGLVHLVVFHSDEYRDLLPLSVEARQTGKKTSIGKAMLQSDANDQPFPTVIETSKEESTTDRRLKRLIVAMTQFKASDRKHIVDIETELEEIELDELNSERIVKELKVVQLENTQLQQRLAELNEPTVSQDMQDDNLMDD